MRRPNLTGRGAVAALALLLPILVPGCPLQPGGGPGTTFNLPPTPVITSDLVRGVAPLTVQFNSDRSSDDGLIVSRLWDFGDGATSQEIAPRHTFATTGDFQVRLTLTDDGGAQASRTLTVAVTEAPLAVIAVTPTAAESAPAVFSFDGSASTDPDGEIVEYQWDFGDGSREFLQSVTHVYATSGTYRARLTVTDNKGVTGTAEKLIPVGIRTPTIEIRVPPAGVENIVVSNESPLWIQAVYEVQAGVAHFARAGLDEDADQCDAQAVLYAISNGSQVAVYSGHEDRINDVAFAPDGGSVFTASDDGTVRRYATLSGELSDTYTGSGKINAVAVSPDGRQLAWAEDGGDVVLAEVASGAVVRTFAGHTGAALDVAFAPDGNTLLSGGNDRRALLWDISDGTVLRDFGHTLGINAVAFSPTDPTMVATGSEDGTIRIWNTNSGALLLELVGHAGPINDLAFSSDGLALISGSDDDTAKAWSPFTGELGATYSGHRGDVVAVAVSPDGLSVITGSADASARTWNSATGQALQSVQPCASTISSVAVSPNGAYLLAGVAARNSIQLDTDPPDGNDLNITVPQPLSLTEVAALDFADVPTGQYYLWAEIDTDRQDKPVRTYATAQINVIDPFTDTPDTDTPVIPLVNGRAAVIVPRESDRAVFDLGPLSRGDRLFVSLLSTPGFGEFYVPSDEFSIMVIDVNQDIFAWYQALETVSTTTGETSLDRFVLFTPHTKLIAGHNSLHYYVVVDGGASVSVRIERDTGLFDPHGQRVLVRFDGGAAVAAGNQPPRELPAFDAADFNEFFSVSPDWGDDETLQLKTAIMAEIEAVYGAFDIEFFTSDDAVWPDPPYHSVYVGGWTPDGLLGISDYIDPRNETATGTAIVYATEIAERGIGGQFANPADDTATLGRAIGRVAAHQIGQLLGLRNTDNATDIMQGSSVRQVGDPTIPRTLKRALVAASEQLRQTGGSRLDPLGYQDAELLLLETVGPR